MPNNSKKPITVSLMAALIICLITFFLGFFISSVAFLDSRLESANEEISALNQTIEAKNVEIDNLNTIINQKNESNIILAETISDHLETIDTLTSRISTLESDVDYVSEVALQSENFMGGSSFISAISLLSASQQLIMLVVLFVIIIFIVSVTCGILAGKNKQKRVYRKETDNAPLEETETEEDETKEEPEEENNEDETEEEPEPVEEEAVEETEEAPSDSVPSSDLEPVKKAVELLYSNALEDEITPLGGFRFGITNFNDILSDKAKGKSFGVVDNGDFVAFMSKESAIKRLYIIPRYMALSDSTVALRGVIDLFTITDEDNNTIDHGTVKIKSINSPAIFAFGEKGWAIESKGSISAYGKKYAQ